MKGLSHNLYNLTILWLKTIYSLIIIHQTLSICFFLCYIVTSGLYLTTLVTSHCHITILLYSIFTDYFVKICVIGILFCWQCTNQLFRDFGVMIMIGLN